MLVRIFDLRRRTARHVMSLRIDRLGAARPHQHHEAVRVALDAGYSRYPVLDESGNVLGYLHLRDLFEVLAGRRKASRVAELLRKPIFAREDTSVERLRLEMQARQIPVAIITSATGEFVGLVTIEDLLEEIVGEIRDETDEEVPPIHRRGGGIVDVDGRVLLADLERDAAIVLKPVAKTVETVGGYILARLEHPAKTGERVECEGLTLVVTDVAGRRVRRVRIVRTTADGAVPRNATRDPRKLRRRRAPAATSLCAPVETLAERIARDGPVSELDAIGWAIRLAKRLEALHALGVAHGSVSPACVIAAGQDRNARAYLADVQHTSATPPYQSPERILGGDISAADDVWALAATLYALLTGQSPFGAGSGTDGELRQKILAASPPPLAVYDVGDDDLQHILDHAFARELGRRTTSINAFRRALEEWHPDRGVANLPPLDDDDATNDDDDGARTMLVHDPGGFLRQSIAMGGAQGPPQTPLGSGAHGAGAIPRVNDEDSDDDDDVRTVMRSFPQDDLAAIVARAKGSGGASGASVASSMASPVRAPVHAPVQAHAEPAIVPLHKIADDDSEDLRTLMRTPEQMAADEALLHHNGRPPAAPAAPAPAPRRAFADHPVGHWGNAPASAATLALPPDGFPEPYLEGPQGTQKIPAGFMLGSLPLAVEPPLQPLQPSIGDMAPRGDLRALEASAPSPPQASAAGWASPAGMTTPSLAGPQAAPGKPTSTTSSKTGLLVAAVIALLIAAAATFAFLVRKGL